jgi:hypothetical protein
LLSKQEARVNATKFDSHQTDDSDQSYDFDYSDTVELLKQEEVIRVEPD